MTQASTPKPNPAEPHPLVRISNLEAKVIQLEERIASLEATQIRTIPAPTPLTTPLREKTPDSSSARLFEIVQIDTRVTEANDTWSKFAWKLVVRNLSDVPLNFHATIEFLDTDGFVVDDTFQPGLVLHPQKEETYTGYELIDASVVKTISSIQAKLRLA